MGFQAVEHVHSKAARQGKAGTNKAKPAQDTRGAPSQPSTPSGKLSRFMRFEMDSENNL